MNENRSSLVVPIALIVFIIVIIIAFYYQKQNPGQNNYRSSVSSELSQFISPASGVNLAKFRPVDNTDKVRGSTNAPIKLVVYTDLECPACKFFHEQLKILENDYVKNGSLAIIYRDFPLDSLHTKSRTEFLAAECVNEIGGLEKYWQFMDKIFEITPSSDGLDLVELDNTARNLGIEMTSFEACMQSNKYATKIQSSVEEAVAMGAKGTPFLVIISGNQIIPVFGGIPAERLAGALDLLLTTEENQVITEETLPAEDLQ